MSPTIRVGLWLLAVGAVAGWLVVLDSGFPQVLSRIGIRSSRRVVQMHLACLMWGPILIGVDLAVPARPAWMTLALIVGALVGPVLFISLAFREHWAKSLAYQAVSAAAFVLINIGLIGAAVEGTAR